jgi:hypothetical protein
MAPQVSAIIRLSSPPISTPSYVTLDSSSEWSKSALLCTAVETVTLPTRLRESKGRPGSLADFESALNNRGARTIFGIEASVVKRYACGREAPGEQVSSPEHRGAPTSQLGTAFDIDYSPRPSQNILGRTPHVFGQVEIWRCLPKILPSTSVEIGGSAKQDGIADM